MTPNRTDPRDNAGRETSGPDSGPLLEVGAHTGAFNSA